MLVKRFSSVATVTLYLNFYKMLPTDCSEANLASCQSNSPYKSQNKFLKSKVGYSTFLLNVLHWCSIGKGLHKTIG